MLSDEPRLEVNGVVSTTAIDKLLEMTKRIREVPGGTSAGKTYGIIPILIDEAIQVDNSEISIVSESIPHLRKGAMKDFLKIMKAIDMYDEKEWNRTFLTYTFPNGSYIEFFSADQEEKVRGPRRNVLYINECNNLKFETYHQLAIRTDRTIWLDYNPTHEFWAHTELADDPDHEVQILTYKDNEALSESIIREIEKAREKGKTSAYWANWWKVYGLGQVGSLQGVIFQNWSQVKKVPVEAVYIGSGMDFGYTTDPTTLVDVYKYEGKYIFDEVIYQTGLLNSDIARLCKDLVRVDSDGKEYTIKRIIVADSAEPKSIAEIQRYGIEIFGASKGSDSIAHGISLLQGIEILVTETSLNLIKEFRAYVWKTDKEGKSINRPVEVFNHAMDAIRYFALAFLGAPRKVDIR